MRYFARRSLMQVAMFLVDMVGTSDAGGLTLEKGHDEAQLGVI